MHIAMSRSRSASKTSSSNQLSCRNSNVKRRPGGSKPRNPRSRSRSFFRFGGSWKRIGPEPPPSADVLQQELQGVGALGLEPRVSA